MEKSKKKKKRIITPEPHGAVSDAGMRGVDKNKIARKKELLQRSGQREKSEVEKSRPYISGEESVSGSASDPEKVHEGTVLERAKDAGLYAEADEENPEELDITKAYDNKKGGG